jgi:hypothetical protein
MSPKKPAKGAAASSGSGRGAARERDPRKLIEFDPETLRALELLARDSMADFQELADEAFRDLLKKHGQPTTLKEALRQSTRQLPANDRAPRARKGR